jgi:hypothetical protein
MFKACLIFCSDEEDNEQEQSAAECPCGRKMRNNKNGSLFHLSHVKHECRLIAEYIQRLKSLEVETGS